MLEATYNSLRPLITFLMRFERNFNKRRRVVANSYPKVARVLRWITLGKMIILSLIAVVVLFGLQVRFAPETLSFMQKDLFFKPLGLLVPFLIGAAMFAVPLRIPVETLAKVGGSVLVTYLLTTVVASSMGYQSVVLFNTDQYLSPLISNDITGEARTMSTDFTLLYIIFFSLLASLIINKMVSGHHKLKDQITFLALAVEKFAYKILYLLLWLMPFAVFASIMNALQTHGLDKLSGLAWFVVYVNIPQILFLFLLILTLKIGPRVTFRFAFNAVMNLAKIAIPTSSSTATILTNVETARKFPIIEKYKNRGLIASFMPFGATVNMSGTAMFITIICKIAANIQGIEVSFWEIIPYAVIYSCAAAAIPSASIVLITAIFQILGIEMSLTVQILGLIIAVDWINDRVRTLLNVTGDLVAIVLSLNERSPVHLIARLFKRIAR